VATSDLEPQADDQESKPDEPALWSAWRSSSDLAARERLVRLHLPYARRIAARLYRQRGSLQVEFDEYYQLACIGLLEAMDRYDASRGASFQTFSLRRIEGSVLNGLQRLSEVTEQVGLRRRMERERLASLKGETGGGRRSSRDMLSQLSEIAVGLAIGYMLEETAMFLADEDVGGLDTAYAGEAWRQTRERVLASVRLLPERERQIIDLHYFNGLGFDQIGAVFGLTKGRISQLHRSALERLRGCLGPADQFRMIR
jgi:RNA polymerase sigma factor for flagellar operon FliA